MIKPDSRPQRRHRPMEVVPGQTGFRVVFVDGCLIEVIANFPTYTAAAAAMRNAKEARNALL